MNPTLTALHERLLDGLSARIDADGAFVDPLTGRPSPADHYGHCAAALALAVARPAAWSLTLRLVRVWLGFDPGHIGHLPFNRLLLFLLGREARERGAGADEIAPIDAALRRCRLNRRYPSNNWTLLARTCRLLEAEGADRDREIAGFCALLSRWTTEAGGFIDFPTDPNRRGRFSTPLAYHHKALFLAALAARHHPDPRLLRQVRRLLDWLVHCWDPAGYAGGFGRSNHALFGDACLLGALILLGQDNDAPRGPVEALARRLTRQQRADGLLWLDPAGPVAGAAAWDRYMYLSVYNAWMAAVVGLARQLGPIAHTERIEHDLVWRADRNGCFHDAQAGLLCLRTERGLNLLMSTRGQAPQAWSRDEVELRYAGGAIVHLTGADGMPRVAPPVRIAKQRLLETPALAGWTPVFACGGEWYGLTDFDSVDVEEDASGATVRLVGHPTLLARGAPSSLWQRLISALDWRLFGGHLGREAALRRPILHEVTGRLRIRISIAPPGIEFDWVFETDRPPHVAYLNPLGHTLVAPDDEAGWIATATPSSLPGARAHCLPPVLLESGRHRQVFSFDVEKGFCPAAPTKRTD